MKGDLNRKGILIPSKGILRGRLGDFLEENPEGEESYDCVVPRQSLVKMV
jgi:hypothetical protein